MDIAFGLKAHSGWAAMVAIGRDGAALRVVDRRRLELADEQSGPWARQPYHAAEGRPPAEARAIVERGIAAARRQALQELRAALDHAAASGHRVRACAVLVGEPMPGWSVEEILVVHFRMHKAEGALYRDVLLHACERCGLASIAIREKVLIEHASCSLKMPAARCVSTIAELGRTCGPPWGKDQKDAALAALITLQGRPARS